MSKWFSFARAAGPPNGIVSDRPATQANRNTAAVYHSADLPQDADGNIQLGADKSEFERWARESSRAVGVHIDQSAIERDSEYIFESRPPDWIFDLRPPAEVKAAFEALTSDDSVKTLENKLQRGIAIFTQEARKTFKNPIQQHDYVAMVAAKAKEILDDGVKVIQGKIGAEVFTAWTDFELAILKDLRTPAYVPSIALDAIIDSVTVKSVAARPNETSLSAVTYTGAEVKKPRARKATKSHKSAKSSKQ